MTPDHVRPHGQACRLRQSTQGSLTSGADFSRGACTECPAGPSWNPTRSPSPPQTPLTPPCPRVTGSMQRVDSVMVGTHRRACSHPTCLTTAPRRGIGPDQELAGKPAPRPGDKTDLAGPARQDPTPTPLSEPCPPPWEHAMPQARIPPLLGSGLGKLETVRFSGLGKKQGLASQLGSRQRHGTK